MVCNLGRFFVFSKSLTCLLLSRQKNKQTKTDLTKQLIRDEDPYGELTVNLSPSLT